jgi:hypothetical protein
MIIYFYSSNLDFCTNIMSFTTSKSINNNKTIKNKESGMVKMFKIPNLH